MTRLVLYLVLSLLVALGAAWLIALPGSVAIDIGSYRLQPGLGLAIFAVIVVIVLAILVWGLLRRIFGAPRALARHSDRKRRDRGHEALSSAMIALQAGDSVRARGLAREARAKLPGNGAAQLLEARAELSLGQYHAAREHYRGLIDNPDTAIAALAGLYEQAREQRRDTAALTFARRAVAISPALGWASDAVFQDLAARGEWQQALEMANERPAQSKSARASKRRRQAVLETALAQAEEETAPEKALEHTLSALKHVPDFVPATLVAARIYINRGDTRRASSLLRRVWRATGHPQVATLYAHVKPGSSAVERLKRVRALIEAPGENREAAIVLARAAVEAYDWSLARNALANFANAEPTQQVCLLMAEVEEGQSGDQGKAREWLSRAVRAPRDPIWTADGVTSEDWAPVSPVTGKLDAFAWKVPVESRLPPAIEAGDTTRLAQDESAQEPEPAAPPAGLAPPR